MKSVGIIGGSGYTGGELIRLVVHHPALALDFVYSSTRPDTPIYDTHQDLLGTTKLDFTDKVNENVDVLFLCLGHGNSSSFLEQYRFSDSTIIIDLSNDFRLQADAEFQGHSFVYGLPEFQKRENRKSKSDSQSRMFCNRDTIGFASFSRKKTATVCCPC